jgi:acetylornithine deacetylase
MTSWTIDRERIAQSLSEMISIDSVNPDLVPGAAGEAEIASWLARSCRELGLEVRTPETAPGRPNVIARWPGSGGGRSLLLTGHVDVVSIEGMEIDPLDPRVEDGKMYGRGAFDMKGGLASILGAVAALCAGGFEPQGDLLLGFVTDEEYKSIGTEALVREIRADAAILAEPTALKICVAHKGFAWLTIVTHGKAAHGSSFHEGIDAIASMGRLLQFMRELEQDVFPMKRHELLQRPSVHAGSIRGGLGISIYPDRCELQIEHRLLPGELPEQTMKTWETELARLRAEDSTFEADVRLDLFRPGYELSREVPIVQTLEDNLRELDGTEPAYAGSSGWLDSALLGAAGIPTVIFGPRGGGAHAAVEWVDLESVFRCSEILATTASRWLNP